MSERRHAGRLVFDSARVMLDRPTRSTLGVDRTLLFRAADYSIDLVLRPGANRFDVVHGHVVRAPRGEPVTNARVAFGEDAPPTSTGAHGDFALSRIGNGADTDLVIDTGELRLICRIPGDAAEVMA